MSSQLKIIQQVKPFELFGDEEIKKCDPFSEEDLATYLMDCVIDKTRENKIIHVSLKSLVRKL